MTENKPTDIVLCTPLRTAVGGYGGQFTNVPVQELAATVVKAVVEKSGVKPEDVDDLILGQAAPNGAAPALGRVVALDAGLGESVPGMQLDRRCGSGLQAVVTAAAHISAGAADLIIAGGAESMSRTDRPEIERSLSSSTVCAAATVFTGASAGARRAATWSSVTVSPRPVRPPAARTTRSRVA